MFVLSADILRLQHSSPILTINGTCAISQKNDAKVWKTLMELLEFRMQRGIFTIIDATHSSVKALRQYEKLCERYRYRVYIKRFDMSIETLIHRDEHREPYKKVPHDAIELMHERLSSISIPSYFTEINEITEINEYIHYDRHCETDRNVYFIGDIHGHLNELKQFIDDYYNDTDLYIFMGDYIGRGYNDLGVINLLDELYENGNVILIEGNHERHIRAYGFDDNYVHSEIYQLIIDGYTRKEARSFYRKLKPFFVFNKNGNNILACHGGISTPYFNFMPTEQLIKGVGKYEDVYKNAVSFTNIGNCEYIQVHGHRSIDTNVMMTNRVYNVNGGLGNGGHLKAIKMFNTGVEEITVYSAHANQEFINFDETIVESEDLITSMINNKDINVHEYGDILSLNFSRKVFNLRKWNENTIKARGLFINKQNNTIVARSYDKFFNLDEFESHSLINIIDKIKFPVTEYRKENGYLGIIGYDLRSDQILYCSKSSITGQHSQWLKNLFSSETQFYIEQIVKGLNVSLVMEVVLPEQDPHIIEYEKPTIYLLDAIKNQIEYESIGYAALQSFALTLREFGLNIYTKALVSISNSPEELIRNIENTKEVTNEGSVFVGTNNFMFKVKSNYYNKWKQLRKIKDTKLFKESLKVSGLAFDIESFRFLQWCKNTYNEEEVKSKSIIQLRKEFLEQS